MLDNHPFFTGVCPQCRHEFDGEGRCFESSLSNRHVDKSNLPAVHWDCHNCGWIDDSV